MTRFLSLRVLGLIMAVGLGGLLAQEGAQETPSSTPAPASAPASESAPATSESPATAPAPAAQSTPDPVTPDKPEAPILPKANDTPEKPATERKAREISNQESYEGKVVVISIGESDLVNPARFEYMSRALKRASDEKAEAVIFDLDTPGGIAWNTTTMIMEDLQKVNVRTIAYVNPRALSAGALIALGTDAIYMSPASTIGAATPVMSGGGEMGDAERAKMNSALMAMARSAAKAKGHREAIANSMVDKDVGLKIGEEEIIPKGQICSLDQEQATRLFDGKPLLAKGIVKSLDELKQKEGLRGETVQAEPKGFERVAIWITQYAAILLIIGLAAGYLEMQTPGLGLAGIVSALAFFTFFFGHYIAGSLIGYETVVLFLFGVVLIIVEFFVLPGYILPGMIGLALVVGSLIYTMSGWDMTIPEDGSIPVRLADYQHAVINVGLALIGSMVAILVMMRYLPDVGPFKKMVLQTAVGGSQASIEGESQRKASSIVAGALGVTRSALRPYGNVEFEGHILEATVEGDYLPQGTQIKVRSVNGGRIVVERV